MKLVCKLEKIVDTITSKGDKYSFMFIPLKKPYDKYVKLVISGDNALEVISNLELPEGQGDTIEIDFSPKQSQGRLPTRMSDDAKGKKKEG